LSILKRITWVCCEVSSLDSSGLDRDLQKSVDNSVKPTIVRVVLSRRSRLAMSHHARRVEVLPCSRSQADLASTRSKTA
jgi:hypothetical protein